MSVTHSVCVCVCASMSADASCVYIIREEVLAAVVFVMFKYQFSARPDSLLLFAYLTLSLARCSHRYSSKSLGCRVFHGGRGGASGEET